MKYNYEKLKPSEATWKPLESGGLLKNKNRYILLQFITRDGQAWNGMDKIDPHVKNKSVKFFYSKWPYESPLSN